MHAIAHHLQQNAPCSAIPAQRMPLTTATKVFAKFETLMDGLAGVSQRRQTDAGSAVRAAGKKTVRGQPGAARKNTTPAPADGIAEKLNRSNDETGDVSGDELAKNDPAGPEFSGVKSDFSFVVQMAADPARATFVMPNSQQVEENSENGLMARAKEPKVEGDSSDLDENAELGGVQEKGTAGDLALGSSLSTTREQGSKGSGFAAEFQANPAVTGLSCVASANHHDVRHSNLPDRNTSADSAGRSGTPPLVLHSYELPAANRIEVGIAGGAMGWLKLRAELSNSGEIHAYLRGGSASVTGLLQAQSPLISQYLTGQDVRLHGLHIEASKAAAGASPASPDSNSGASGRENAPRRLFRAGRRDAAVSSSAQVMSPVTATIAAGPLSLTGAWFSARA